MTIPHLEDPDDYDTLTGIEAQVLTLEGLHGVVQARARAAKGKDARPLAQAFIVFGRIALHKDGNALGLETRDGRLATAADFGTEGLPTVSTFADLRRDTNGTPSLQSWETRAPLEFAPVGRACAGCNRPWTIVDAFDYASHSTGRALDISTYAGQTLEAVLTDLRTYPNREAYLDPHAPLRREGISAWLTPDQVRTFQVQAGDRIHVFFKIHEHLACRRQRVERETRTRLEKVLKDAGFDLGQLTWTEIPNPYGLDLFDGPWFVVEDSAGSVALGNSPGGTVGMAARWRPANAGPSDPPFGRSLKKKELTYFPYPYLLTDHLRAKREEALRG